MKASFVGVADCSHENFPLVEPSGVHIMNDKFCGLAGLVGTFWCFLVIGWFRKCI